MPNRIIKESIRTSDTINSLSWFEEVLFYRLIVSCDDYGRFDGRPAIIKGTCFPLKEAVTAKSIEEALDKLATAGLVDLYTVDGKPILQLPTWKYHQTVRAAKSKYPEKGVQASEKAKDCSDLQTSASKCKQMSANVPVNEIRETKSEYEYENSSGVSVRVREKIEEFRAYLERLEGKPVTTAKTDIVVRKLLSLSKSESEQIKLLDEAMQNGWKNVYKSERKKSKKPDINRPDGPDYNALAVQNFLGRITDDEG